MTTQNISIENLQALNNFISVETVEALNTSSPAMTKLAELVTDTGNYVKSRLNALTVFFSNKEQYPNIKRFVENNKFMDSNKVYVVIPEGFKGNLSEYSTLLLKIQNEFIDNFIADFITPYDSYISKLINNPTLLESINYKHNAKIKDTSGYTKALAKFNSMAVTREETLGKCFSNMKQFELMVENTISLLKEQERNNVANIKEAIIRLDQKLNILANTITDNSNNINIKASVVKTLSDLTLELAKQTEFVAVVFTLINSFIGSVNYTEERFKDVR